MPTAIVGVIIALKVAIDKNIGGIGDKFKVLVDKLKVTFEILGFKKAPSAFAFLFTSFSYILMYLNSSYIFHLN